MDGEIDLELYTLSIIRLNSALSKLGSCNDILEIQCLFEESFNDLQKFYENIVNDLNRDEVNPNEYYMFFQNGQKAFPQFIEVLGNIENETLDEILSKLINVFSNLNKISDTFPTGEMIK